MQTRYDIESDEGGNARNLRGMTRNLVGARGGMQCGLHVLLFFFFMIKEPFLWERQRQRAKSYCIWITALHFSLPITTT